MTLVGHRALEHIGLTVPDLAAAIAFFERVLGAVVVFRDGPVTNVELIAFSGESAGAAPAVSAPGGHHLALRVDDLGRSLRALAREPGVQLLGELRTIPADRPHGGTRDAYASTSWGLKLELVELPVGALPEMSSTVRRYWTPFGWHERP